jgi:hypothetical protein
MNSHLIRAALLFSFALASPFFALAASQPKLHPASDMQKPVAAPQAVQFGKGAGMTRNTPVLRENTLRLSSAIGSLARANAAAASTTDSAFRK